MNEVDDYIKSIPPQRGDRFKSIHKLIMQRYPDATVDMSYRMPTCRISDTWVALANQKQYISLYTCSASHLESYKQKYPQQKMGKGCINFRDSDEIHYENLELVIRHAIKCAKNLTRQLGKTDMIKHEFRENDGILIIEPESSLQASDFDTLSSIVDPYIRENGKLNGLVIHTESFPGWQDFGAMLAHIKFVKDHHAHISKVAAVADEGIVAILPTIADHFVRADVKHFGADGLDSAIEWTKQA